MIPLPSVAAIYAQMDQARRAGPLVTNFYPVPDKLQRSIERGELFSISAGPVLLVLRRDRDFLHLSFVAPTAAELATAVREQLAQVGETITVDLLGPRARLAELVAVLTHAGFADHCVLQRMTRVTSEVTATSPDPQIKLAGPDDAPALAAMIDAAHDRHAEQLPTEDELARAAADRQILVIKSGAAIAGVLFFEVTGQSSLLRHWLVDPACRDQRIGARLMRRYFADCSDVRRFLLWVVSDNDNAIDRYRHYGYQPDGLIDQVLIRRPS